MTLRVAKGCVRLTAVVDPGGGEEVCVRRPSLWESVQEDLATNE